MPDGQLAGVAAAACDAATYQQKHRQHNVMPLTSLKQMGFTLAAGRVLQGLQLYDMPGLRMNGMRGTCVPNNRLASNKEMYGVLLLAMNSSNQDAAFAAAELLVSMQSEHSSASGWSALGAAAVSRLVITAITWQHSAAVLHMTSSREVLQQLDARAYQAVLLNHIKKHDPASLAEMLRASSAQQLSTNAVMALLLAAVQSQCCVEQLRELPAAQQLRSDEVLQLLQAAVAQDSTSITDRLFELPAAQQFGGDMVAQLLETAISKGTSANRLALFNMQPVQQLSASLVARLLEAAIEHDDGAAVAQLLGLESAQKLTLSSVERLVAAALQRGPDMYSWRLFRVPAAAQLSSTEVEALIVTALERGKDVPLGRNTLWAASSTTHHGRYCGKAGFENDKAWQ
jgi:hypothetical protein